MGHGSGKGSDIGKIVGIIVVIYILISLFSGGHGGPFSVLFKLLGFFFWGGFLLLLICLGITAAVIYFTVRDNKYRKPHDPPSVTPSGAKEAKARGNAYDPESSQRPVKQQNTAGAGNAGKTGAAGSESAYGKEHDNSQVPANYPVADRSRVYEKTPEGIMQMLSDYKIDYVLGQVASDACRQRERLTKQQEHYRRLVERRFGHGTLSAEKYLTVEKSSNDAMHNCFLRIANRMEAFDTKEYMHFKSGAYKYDSIPNHVQEQRQEIYEENLRYMKECLADNEHILAGMDRLMLKLADAEVSDENSITEEIEQLEKQLEYYRKQL